MGNNVPTDRVKGLTLKAPAKINLFLKVLNRRPDGYHEIESMMQKIALFDILHLARRGRGISLSCPGGKVPAGSNNLVYRAAEIFFAVADMAPGIDIVLEKNIPVAAGLGGGSSDAAAVLLGLNRLFGAGFEQKQLLEIGLRLGADVPFFVQDSSAALAGGIGERLQPAPPLRGYWFLLVNPGFAVSTKWVFENFPLTSAADPYILARGRKVADRLQAPAPDLFAELGNDLEAVTIKRYPEIGDIKKELLQAGAAAALMSGSGPTVFGLFADRQAARYGLRLFAAKFGDKVFLVPSYIS